MDAVCHCSDSLADILDLAEELARFGGSTIHFRCLYHQENTLDLVEEF